MEKLVINGGKPLNGSISLGGAKNAGYKLMIASLLTEGENTFTNVTNIGDVETVFQIINLLGGNAKRIDDKIYTINSSKLHTHKIPEIYGEKSRASLLFAGPLLARFGVAVLPFPGGDRIGFSRDIDRHIEGIEEFGVTVEVKGNFLYLSSKKLIGCTYTLKKPSHTATENLIMTGVLAEGKTILHNCGLEPEIDDLIKYLCACGAKIKRTQDRTIEISGTTSLKGKTHIVTPDRNQVVTYAIAAVITGGRILIEDAIEEHVTTFLHVFKKANGGYTITNSGIEFFYNGEINPTDVVTGPHPGFMTDWQPLWATFMTQANGTSTIVETIYDNRFQYVEVLNKAGAQIKFFDPKPKNPNTFYNFNISPSKKYDKQGIMIKGPTKLSPLDLRVWDVRFGATLLLAALTIPGKSELRDIYHIDRGYDQIDKKMRSLGADIVRVEEKK